MTTSIPIYDSEGIQISDISIDANLNLSDGARVSYDGEKYYYKGIGTVYKQHWLTDPIDPELYNIGPKSDIFYMGNVVAKKCFVGKTGIFQEKYQPQFEDFIGSCGVKELSIIEHSTIFDRSDVEVIKSYKYDITNNQYYFKLLYKSNRISYLQDSHPKALTELLKYMVQENWNFIWDKRSITDISKNGYVTDVADIFYSKELINKLGTVYSVIYSLANTDNDKYIDFLRENHMHHLNQMTYVFAAVEILKRNGVDVSPFFMYDNDVVKNYRNIVENYLVLGKNCGHCSFVGLGDKIKEEYQLSARNAFRGR